MVISFLRRVSCRHMMSGWFLEVWRNLFNSGSFLVIVWQFHWRMLRLWSAIIVDFSSLKDILGLFFPLFIFVGFEKCYWVPRFFA